MGWLRVKAEEEHTIYRYIYTINISRIAISYSVLRRKRAYEIDESFSTSYPLRLSGHWHLAQDSNRSFHVLWQRCGCTCNSNCNSNSAAIAYLQIRFILWTIEWRHHSIKIKGICLFSTRTFKNFIFFVKKAKEGFRRLLTPLQPLLSTPLSKKIRFPRLTPLVFHHLQNVRVDNRQVPN